MSKRVLKEFNHENLKNDFCISQERINKIEKEAREELKLIDSFKKEVTKQLVDYKTKNKLSVRDLAVEFDTTSISYIQGLLKGGANITMETVFKIGQIVGKKPHIVWE